MVILEVVDVAKTYNKSLIKEKVQALKSVGFKLEQPGVVGFLGPNGSGKSTLIRIMMGLTRSNQGQVSFFGGKSFEHVKERVGYVPEKPSFPLYLTGMEVLNLSLSLTPNHNSELSVQTVMEKLNLWEFKDRLVRSFSKGMLQKMALAQALVHDPDLLILDEPFSGVDPHSRRDISNLLQERAKAGKTIFLTSHLLEDVEKICTHIIVLSKGNLVFDGNISRLFGEEKYLVETNRDTYTCSLSELESTLKDIFGRQEILKSIKNNPKDLLISYEKILRLNENI